MRAYWSIVVVALTKSGPLLISACLAQLPAVPESETVDAVVALYGLRLQSPSRVLIHDGCQLPGYWHALGILHAIRAGATPDFTLFSETPLICTCTRVVFLARRYSACSLLVLRLQLPYYR